MSEFTGKIFWDLTKSGKTKTKSGINRVSQSIFNELKVLLGEKIQAVYWNKKKQDFGIGNNNKALFLESDDNKSGNIFITAEVFCESERIGFSEWLNKNELHNSVIFHDAIPLRHPEFTWPHSVARHPFYMKMLALFDSIYSVSDHSQNCVENYLQWLDLKNIPLLKRIHLGANSSEIARQYKTESQPENNAEVLMVGIIEPRKNQSLALKAAKTLWDDGQKFTLHICGRVNPHFGKSILKTIKQMIKKGYSLHYHDAPSDSEITRLYQTCSFSLFPSIDEGCGIPLLESMWMGLPVICSDIPSLMENAKDGGALPFTSNNADELAQKMRQLLEPEKLAHLNNEIKTRSLPTWEETASKLINSLK